MKAPAFLVDLVGVPLPVDRAIGPTRFLLSLLAAFAGLAVVLAGVGIYGVLSYDCPGRVGVQTG